jgi:hypothetical protein
MASAVGRSVEALERRLREDDLEVPCGPLVD